MISRKRPSPVDPICNFDCRLNAPIPLWRAKLAAMSPVRTHVRMDPSDELRSLRTHVPVIANIHVCPARTRCPASDPLVPFARGRLRRRLGGRPERAPSDAPSAPSAAARALPAAPRRRSRAGNARMPLPPSRRSRSSPADGPRCFAATYAHLLATPEPQRGHKDERTALRRPAVLYEKTGGVLLSQALAGQVPSALRGLTALFGMGRGVSPSPRPPEKGERPRPPGPSKLHSATASIKKIRQALDPLVPVSFRRYRPSRSGLST